MAGATFIILLLHMQVVMDNVVILMCALCQPVMSFSFNFVNQLATFNHFHLFLNSGRNLLLYNSCLQQCGQLETRFLLMSDERIVLIIFGLTFMLQQFSSSCHQAYLYLSPRHLTCIQVLARILNFLGIYFFHCITAGSYC